jgi:hypothetical protein
VASESTVWFEETLDLAGSLVYFYFLKQKQIVSKNAGWSPWNTNFIICSYKYKKLNRPISIYIKFLIIKSAIGVKRAYKYILIS